MRVADEHYFHTPEQVSEHLRAALDICDAHDLPPEMVEAVVPTLLTLLTQKQVTFEQVAPMGMVLPRH